MIHLIYVCVEKQIIMTDKNNILYLFDRPTEPIFIGKGDENVSFDVPAEYLVSRTSILVLYRFQSEP